MYLQESGGGLGKLDSNPKSGEAGTGNALLVPCIPVASLLLALNRTTVDYFSLDVEGFEYDVIRTLPLEKFNIRSWSIEYSHTNHKALKQHLIEHGYDFKKQINAYDAKISLVAEDYIFLKK